MTIDQSIWIDKTSIGCWSGSWLRNTLAEAIMTNYDC